MLEITSVLLALTAVLAYLNHRFIGLPTTIGVMAASLLLSLALIGLDAIGFDPGLRAYEQSLLRSVDFANVLMQGMLSFLLFAGALHVDLTELGTRRWQVAALAVLGTLLSTVLVGLGTWLVLPWVGLPLPLIYCLIFGALISPTDPIAVMGILTRVGAPKELEVVIAGESLFNDGVGVVLFSILLGVLLSGEYPTWTHGAELLAHEVGGGVLFGLALGYLTFWLLRSVDNYHVEVLLTLAAVMGGYTLALRMHVSGPLAMVVVGLMIGNHGRALAMSDTTRRYIDMFWELVDEILNAVLFVMIGMEVMVIEHSAGVLMAGLAALLVTLLARVLTVGVPLRVFPRFFQLGRGSATVLTWGGLRGGISVALVLSLPGGSQRDALLAITYLIVVFSVLVQGLSVGRVLRAKMPAAAPASADTA